MRTLALLGFFVALIRAVPVADDGWDSDGWDWGDFDDLDHWGGHWGDWVNKYKDWYKHYYKHDYDDDWDSDEYWSD